MCKIVSICVFLIFCLFLILGCGDTNIKQSEYTDSSPYINSKSVHQDQHPQSTSVDINKEILGLYNGIQPFYFLKNQNGDDMVKNGNKIPIPTIDYKFILKKIISLRCNKSVQRLEQGHIMMEYLM